MFSLALQQRQSALSDQLAMVVRERATEWFRAATANDALPDAHVVSCRRRTVSVIYRLQVRVEGRLRHLVAKQYREWIRQTASSFPREELARPRLYRLCDIEHKAPFEYAALAAIHQHFEGLADPRFRAVRPLAVLPHDRTIVMEDARSTNLARLLERCHRLATSPKRLRLHRAFRHAGAWLRRYHELAPLPHTRVRHAHREEFLDSVQRIASYLIGAVGADHLLRAAIDRVSAVARAVLPAHLPVGLCHTDFAPRNVLADAEGSVAVIDTLGRWQAPVYEDAGYFLMALRTGAVQMYSQGWWLSTALLNDFEKAFLDGYFESHAPPRQAVRLFEVQALLYRWVAISHGAHKSVGIRRLAKRCRHGVTNRFLAGQLQRLISELGS